MDNYLGIFDIVTLLLGLYFLYIFVQTKFMGKPLNVSNFMPSNMPLRSCKQPEAFAAFILPRILIFGLLLVVYSVVSYLQLVDFIWAYLIFPVLIVFYIVTIRQARRFWKNG